MTSTFSPVTVSRISVTSSGRSSIRRMIRCISGWFFVMVVATCFNRVVFPAFGGDTIMPRCPFPIGDSRSITRIAMEVLTPGYSRCRRSFGKIGVRFSKFGRFSTTLVGYPLTELIYNNAANFSVADFTRRLPRTISPVFRLKRRIWDGAT